MKYDPELKKKYLVPESNDSDYKDTFYLSKKTIDRINEAASSRIRRNNEQHIISHARAKDFYSK